MKSILLVAAFCLTSAASAQEAPAPAAPAATEAKPKLICRRNEDTGTRLAGKTCLTKEQWAERRKREFGGEGVGDQAERQGAAQAN